MSVRAADPPNADMEARCFRDLECTLDAEIDFQSIKDCCVNDPRGTSFNIPGTEICSPCIGKDNLFDHVNKCGLAWLFFRLDCDYIASYPGLSMFFKIKFQCM